MQKSSRPAEHRLSNGASIETVASANDAPRAVATQPNRSDAPLTAETTPTHSQTPHVSHRMYLYEMHIDAQHTETRRLDVHLRR